MEIDFTQLQKRGLLKKPSEPVKQFQMKGDVLDLSAQTLSQANNVMPATTQSSPFDFLESFASASAPTPAVQQTFSPDMNSLHDKLALIQSSMDKLVTNMDNIFYRIGEIEARLRSR